VNEIRNALAIPVEDSTSNNILCNTLEICNKGDIRKKLKLHLIAYLCSTFRKCSVDSVESWHVADAASVWQRMCTAWWQHHWGSTLMPDRAMLSG
jgi:hypothetical protein